jgi:hypothetical protein
MKKLLWAGVAGIAVLSSSSQAKADVIVHVFENARITININVLSVPVCIRAPGGYRMTIDPERVKMSVKQANDFLYHNITNPISRLWN